MTEHKDRPDPQCTPGGEQNDAKPPNSIAVEGPEPLPVRVGRQISGQQPDQPEGYDDPAVGTILAYAGAQISATEERDARKGEEHDCKSNQGGMGEEGGKPTPAEDGETEIGEGPYDSDQRQSGCGHHGRLAESFAPTLANLTSWPSPLTAECFKNEIVAHLCCSICHDLKQRRGAPECRYCPTPVASALRALLCFQHEELVSPGFGAPDFALAARELPYVRVAIG